MRCFFHINLDLINTRVYFCCSVVSCVQLCDLVEYTMPGSSVLHYILEFAQIHVHWVSDAI